MTTPATDDRARYLKLIEATLRHALSNCPPPPANGPLTMELALPAIARRLGIDDGGALARSVARLMAAPPGARVNDGAGQTRSTYRPMLIAALAPIGRHLAHAEAGAVALANAAGPLLAADGAAIVGHAFDALTCATADPDSPAARAAFARIVSGQAPDGTFLARTSADQLEPAWYHELAVLHAVRRYAELTGFTAAHEAAAASARYHAAEVQPDHASSHPFGVAALMDDPEGIFLADMMLHAAGVQQPATMDAVSLVLLSHAIDEGR